MKTWKPDTPEQRAEQLDELAGRLPDQHDKAVCVFAAMEMRRFGREASDYAAWRDAVGDALFERLSISERPAPATFTACIQTLADQRDQYREAATSGALPPTWILVSAWIPARQPTYVLVWDGHSVDWAWYHEDEKVWLTANESELHGVTHWMPPPPAPGIP